MILNFVVERFFVEWGYFLIVEYWLIFFFIGCECLGESIEAFDFEVVFLWIYGGRDLFGILLGL